MSKPKIQPDQLRSRQWFNNPADPEMTALYTERYLNYGLTREELQGGKPIIGIAQTGSDLSPCNRPHLDLEKKVMALSLLVVCRYRSLFTPCRKQANAPPPCWTETSPI